MTAEATTKTVHLITCPRCDYQWFPRIERPKSCPQCKQRLPTPEDLKAE